MKGVSSRSDDGVSRSDDCDSCSADNEDDVRPFSASWFQECPRDIRPLPLHSIPSSDTFSTAADEIFNETPDVVSLLSASEECPKESSDANFFNLTFCLPEKDFKSYFSGSNKSVLIDKISSISIPKGILQIEPECFMGFSLLTNISIPNSVISIGKNAFCDCSLLTNISIPNSVISIGSYAFYNCSLLTNISIPNSVIKIGKNAFSGCSSLINIAIPNNIKKIGNNILPGPFLFKQSKLRSIQISNVNGSFNRRIVFGKKYLCSIEIPTSVKFVNVSKFDFTSSNIFIIPNRIEYISKYAFFNSSLISILIPHGVKKIGKYAFSGCSSLINITIPYSVKKIGKYAFSGCSSLANISIPFSVKKIGDCAFKNCISLPKSFSIPLSVKKVGSDIFLIKNSEYIY